MQPRATFVAARILIASVFAGIGIERLIAAAGLLPGHVPPTNNGVLLSVFELLAGLALMVGWQVCRIALLMAVFLIVDAIFRHPFWAKGGYEQQNEMLHFLKNISGAGGLLLLSWIEGQEVKR